MKAYFYILTIYNTGPSSGHCLSANSKKDALLIAEKHGIANPFNSNNVKERRCEKLDMRLTHNKRMISRRKHGRGGNLWYEDHNGDLQKEME